MKIISWNAHQKFRQKIREILKYDADIYVIQECEKPDILIKENPDLDDLLNNSLWVGNNESKGLGIFAKPDINLSSYIWDSQGLEYFISCRVNNDFDLIGVWEPHIEEFYVYNQLYGERFSDKQIIIGDFNANARGDKHHRDRCFSNVVKLLGEKGLVSAYHEESREKLGEESVPTFIRGETIRQNDYCFLPKKMLKSVMIGKEEDWLSFSDHLPLIVEIII